MPPLPVEGALCLLPPREPRLRLVLPEHRRTLEYPLTQEIVLNGYKECSSNGYAGGNAHRNDVVEGETAIKFVLDLLDTCHAFVSDIFVMAHLLCTIFGGI